MVDSSRKTKAMRVVQVAVLGNKKEQTVSIQAMSFIWKYSKERGDHLLLLLAIADYANDKGMAWPSINSLSLKTRTSTRTVQRYLKKLESSGSLSIVPNGGMYKTSGGFQKTNLYVINSRGVTTCVIPFDQGGDSPCTKGVTHAVTQSEEGNPSIKKKNASIEEESSILKAISQPEQNTKTSPPVARPPSPKVTWVTPFVDTWKKYYKGNLAVAKVVRVLSSLVKEHGTILVQKSFESYCKKTEIQFASVNRFSETFGQWSKEHAQVPQTQADRYQKPTRQ
jgi:hypothetical protein